MVPPELECDIAQWDLDALLADERLRLKEFPVARGATYLAHAAVSPLPARVAAKMARFVQRCSEEGQFQHLYRQEEAEARARAAILLGVEPEEIAFAASTSAGISSIVEGVNWQATDNIVVPDLDFPSTLYAARSVTRLGVEVRRAPCSAVDCFSVPDLAPYVDKQTRLVLLSSINYLTGSAIDLEAIGEWLQKQGILFGIDGIQSLGAVPVCARNVDFLCADGHKWLLAPQGCAILYVNRRRFPDIRPILEGWKNVPDPRDYGRLQEPIGTSAQRFEPGSLNAVGIVGLHAALTLILGFGMSRICGYLTALRARLVAELTSKGYRVLGPAAREIPTPITSFASPRRDVKSLYHALNEAKVIVSLRRDPAGGELIRVAPHFYNSSTEIDRLLDLV